MLIFGKGEDVRETPRPSSPHPTLTLPTVLSGYPQFLSGAGTTGQRCQNMRPLLAAARRLPLVPRARHPPPGHAPPTTPQLVERPLQLGK
jgi:hypothetical protein